MKKEDIFTRNLDARENEIKKLRQHIIDLEGSEQRISSELEQQLGEKEQQIKKLIQLLNSREDTNRHLSVQLGETIKTEQQYASKIKDAIRKKELTHREVLESLTKQISDKNKRIEELHEKILTLEKKKVLKPYDESKTITLLKDQLKSLQDDSLKQDEFNRRETRQLKENNKVLQDEIRESANRFSTLQQKLARKEREVARLKRHSKLDNSTAVLTEELESTRKELDKKEAHYSKRIEQLTAERKILTEELEAERARIDIVEKKMAAQDRETARLMRIKSMHSPKHNQVHQLRQELQLREKLTNELEQKYNEQDHRQNVMIKQLQHDITDYREQIKHLEALVSDKELIRHRLERNFRQQLRTRQHEIERLNEELRDEHGRRAMIKERKEIAKQAVQLKVKDEEIHDMTIKMDKLDTQNKSLHRRLSERQKLYLQAQQTYDALVRELRGSQEERIKELVRKHTEKELHLRDEIERIRSGVTTREKVLNDKKKEIDDALEQFTSLTSKMMILRGESKTETNYIAKKEKEIEAIMSETTDRAEEILKRERELDRRDKELARHQKAVERELHDIRNQEAHSKILAPESPIETKRELHPDKREHAINILSKEPQPAHEIHGPLVQAKARAEGRDVFAEAQSKVEPLPQPESIREKAERITKRPNREFPSLEHYNEIDEIVTIVRIGIEHGDTHDQIKKSLSATGYSNDAIEKAFKKA